MAFATSNVTPDVAGTLKIVKGYWSGNAGDAAGTFAVAGGQVYEAMFQDMDTTGPTMYIAPTSFSTSGYITTITVYNNQNVTTGRFMIKYA